MYFKLCSIVAYKYGNISIYQIVIFIKKYYTIYLIYVQVENKELVIFELADG